MNLSQQIYLKKLEKKKYLDINTVLVNKISEQRMDFITHKDAVEYDLTFLIKACNTITKGDDEKTKEKKMMLIQKISKQEEMLKISEEYYKKCQLKIQRDIVKNQKIIENIENIIENLKIDYNNYAKEQRGYYMELLKKGIDVR